MRRWCWIAVGVCTTCLAVLPLVGFGVYRASQAEPEFYQRALSGNAPEQEFHGDEFERQLFELHNEALTSSRWQATFTDGHINGWLASDLPLKFPQLLPPGAKDPRVAITKDRVQVACRYETARISTVISLDLEIHLSDEPNTVSVRISRARAGRVPVPLKQFLDKAAALAKTTDIPFRWAQTEGDPVALVTIPARHKDYIHREVHVESVELREGEVFLSGHTASPPRLASLGKARPARVAFPQSAETHTIQR